MSEIWDGLKSSFHIETIWHKMREANHERRMAILKVAFTNGVLYTGSQHFFDYLLEGLSSRYCLSSLQIMGLHSIVFVLWTAPLYLLVLQLLNSRSYQQLKTSVDRGIKLTDFADELYRMVFVAVYLLEIYALSFTLSYFQVFGALLSKVLLAVMLAWLYALYSLDLQCQATLRKRLQMIEKRPLYWFGFGLPLSLLTAMLPFWKYAGCWALLFSLNVLSLEGGLQAENTEFRPRIFAVPLMTTDVLIRKLTRRQSQLT